MDDLNAFVTNVEKPGAQSGTTAIESKRWGSEQPHKSPERKDTMTTNRPSLPIIVPVDEIVHTPEHPQCDDLRCPCQDEVEDEIILSMPTEEQLDAQEQSVLGPRRIDWNKIFE